jgi:hypothetical protein
MITLTQEEHEVEYEDFLHRMTENDETNKQEYLEVLEAVKEDHFATYAALDRAFRTFEDFNRNFLEDTVLLANKELWIQANKVSTEMFNLYQELGTQTFKLTDPEEV